MIPVHRDICVYLNSMLKCRYWTKQQILLKYINIKYIYVSPLYYYKNNIDIFREYGSLELSPD